MLTLGWMLQPLARLFVFAALVVAGSASAPIGPAESAELSGDDDQHHATVTRAHGHAKAPRLIASLAAQTISLPLPHVARLGAHDLAPRFISLLGTPTRARAPPPSA